MSEEEKEERRLGVAEEGNGATKMIRYGVRAERKHWKEDEILRITIDLSKQKKVPSADLFDGAALLP